MKRAFLFLLALVLMAAPAALAQSQGSEQSQQEKPAAKKPKPLDPADVETLTGRPTGQATAEPAPKPGHPLAGERAPKKGHPLDWRDVDILTGKADRYAQRGYAAPYVYADVPVSGSRFGTSQFGSSQFGTTRFGTSRFATVTTEVSPLPFIPLGNIGTRRFGFAGGRSFVFARRPHARIPTFLIF